MFQAEETVCAKAQRRPVWLEWSEGERGSEGRGWGQVMHGLVGLWDGLGFYPEGGSWEPWRAVGRGKTGSNLGAQRRPLAAAGEHTVGQGLNTNQ